TVATWCRSEFRWLKTRPPWSCPNREYLDRNAACPSVPDRHLIPRNSPPAPTAPATVEVARQRSSTERAHRGAGLAVSQHVAARPSDEAAGPRLRTAYCKLPTPTTTASPPSAVDPGGSASACARSAASSPDPTSRPGSPYKES